MSRFHFSLALLCFLPLLLPDKPRLSCSTFVSLFRGLVPSIPHRSSSPLLWVAARPHPAGDGCASTPNHAPPTIDGSGDSWTARATGAIPLPPEPSTGDRIVGADSSGGITAGGGSPGVRIRSAELDGTPNACVLTKKQVSRPCRRVETATRPGTGPIHPWPRGAVDFGTAERGATAVRFRQGGSCASRKVTTTSQCRSSR